MNPAEPTVSVAFPIPKAFDWMKRILFQPFDLYRWLVIGFTAWLASLGENWSGGGGTGGGRQNGGTGVQWEPRELWNEARSYIADNITWLIPTLVVVVFAAIALGILILWVSSRGRFMFLHNVALNQADIVAPWHAFEKHGNSLFVVRLIVGLAALVLSLPLLIVLGAASIPMMNSGALAFGGVVFAAAAILGLMVLGVVYALFEKLTKDFVVPIMWMRQPSCRIAWAEFWTLLRSHLGHFALYILFHILLTVGAGVLIFAVILLTCCIAGCFFALPYLGTVFLLPFFVFFRSYSLLYLAQYGPGFSVFQSPRPVSA